MPILLIDKIKQKNNGKFKLVDAADVEYNGKGLDEAIKSGEFKGDKGDAGPVGPAGAKGEQGETGPTDRSEQRESEEKQDLLDLPVQKENRVFRDLKVKKEILLQ